MTRKLLLGTLCLTLFVPTLLVGEGPLLDEGLNVRGGHPFRPISLVRLSCRLRPTQISRAKRSTETALSLRFAFRSINF